MEDINLRTILALSTILVGTLFASSQANADHHHRGSDNCYDVCNPCAQPCCDPCEDHCCYDPCCDPCCSQWYIGAQFVHSGIFERDRHSSYGFAEAKNHWGGEVFIGYDFCNCWALEFGYVHLGTTHLNDNLDVNQAGGHTGSSLHQYQIRKTYGFPLRFVWSYPLMPCLDFVAYVGALFYSDKYSNKYAHFEATPAGGCSDSHTGVDLTWGFGAEYVICNDFAVRLSWTRYNFNHSWNHKSTVNLGVIWKF